MKRHVNGQHKPRMQQLMEILTAVTKGFEGRPNTLQTRREMQVEVNNATKHVTPYIDEMDRKVLGFRVVPGPTSEQPIVTALFECTVVLARTEQEFLQWCNNEDIDPKLPYWRYIKTEHDLFGATVDHIVELPGFGSREDATRLALLARSRIRKKPPALLN